VHPVVAALRERPAGARVALAIEGGGMRGAVTGGMVLALHELGLHRAFDAVYGASAGALNGMWLVSGRVPEGIATWTEAALVHRLIKKRRALVGRPVVDVRTLVEERYEQLAPGLFADVLAAPAELHPLATDVESGTAADLHPEIRDAPTLRLALRASSALPLLAGPPVALGGRRLLDAGLSAAIPFRAALADGATHVLVLRSRREGERAQAPSPRAIRIVRPLLGRIGPQVAEAFVSRAAREAGDEALLAEHAAAPEREPHILSVRPAPGTPVPGRLERDLGVVRGGLEAGRVALRAALDGAA
jgi:predicted patatin/cPLA2 family phospholipase